MKKKILVIGSSTLSLVNFRLDLLIELINNGYEVHALGPDFDKNSIKILQENSIIFNQYYLSRHGFNPVKDIRTIYSLRFIYNKIKPDYVLPYTVKPVIYSNIAKYGLKINSLNWITGLGYYGLQSTSFREQISKQVITLLYKLSFNSKDILVFQNKEDIDFFSKKGILKKNKYYLTPGSGINLNSFPFSVPDSTHVKFIFVGRLIEPKGIRLFMDAAKTIKGLFTNVEFVVAGGLDTTNPKAVNKRDLELLINDGIINYVGNVNNIIDYVSASSVFVLPSIYREGVPRSILEALSIGRAIITTDNVGCRETVINNYNGVLIKKNSLDDLIDAMKFFCENKDLIIKYGKNSRSLAIEKFDVKIVNKIIINALESFYK